MLARVGREGGVNHLRGVVLCGLHLLGLALLGPPRLVDGALELLGRRRCLELRLQTQREEGAYHREGSAGQRHITQWSVSASQFSE